MSGTEKNGGSSSKDGDGDPPRLNIKLPRMRDLPNKSKPWNDDHLPVDILLLTVEDCEFLACYYYLRSPFKSYRKSLGPVYFGNMGDEEKPLKVALMRSSGPGGSQTVVKNAVTQLRPKAVYSSGFCSGLNREKTKLGDVVVSSMLTTESYKTPVSRDIAHVIGSISDGWEAPLENPGAREVRVHRDGEILSCPDPQQRTLHPEAIAVEMEGKGIYLAAHDLKMEWVIVKGVSSFADGSISTNESWKTFACCMAASLISNMLNDAVIFEDWPHCGDISAGEASSSNTRSRELPCSSDTSAAERSTLEERFDLRECQRQVQDNYNTKSKVKIIPWDSSAAVHINEIYTELSWVKDDVKASDVTKAGLEDYTDILKGDKHYGNPKRTVVYGRPGIGKTVFTQKITYDWSQQKNKVFGKFDLALLIKLRNVCGLRDIPAILTASELLASDSMISVQNLYQYVRNNQEKVLLVLDGFDEYSAGASSPVVDIWEGRLLRDCHVIITTREEKSGLLRRHSHVQFQIDGFKGQDQIERFSRKLLKGEDNVKKFVEYLEEKDLEGMAEIPLLLLMLCLLWKENDGKGLPKSRAVIYTNFIQTLLNHMSEKHGDSDQFEKVDDYKEELCTLGRLAFDALLQDDLSFRFSELPDGILISKLIEVGLFQVLNAASLNPAQLVVFIHKSVQEFLAAFYLKEELLKDESATCLSEVDSCGKIVKMTEVFKFTCELSAEAACAVLSHLGMVGKKEHITRDFYPSKRSFSNHDGQRFTVNHTEEEQFLTLISHSFFCCSAEKRRQLYSMYLSYVEGILFIDSDQLHSVANEHLLKSVPAPKFIFFSDYKHPERSYQDLITVVEDVNAVVVSCSGEKKASDLLKKYSFCPAHHFFLKKEKKMNLYIDQIDGSAHRFPTEMLRELISPPESTQKKKKKKPHCLSCVGKIVSFRRKRQEMETLIDVLSFATSPQQISISSCEGPPELMEALVSSINFTPRLEFLNLHRNNLTAKPAAVIARSLCQAPNLRVLALSANPLGEGLSDLTRHLSSTPHLEHLYLLHVKMTKKQMNDLTEAVRQSNISDLNTLYHDYEGNIRPGEWSPEDYWESVVWRAQDEQEPGTSSESEDEQEPWTSSESDDEQEPWI